MKDSTYIRQVWKQPPKHGHCKIHCGHFKKWKGMGRLKEEQWILPFLKREKLKEAEWIKTRRAAYPYGMNDKLGNETTINKDELLRSQFPPLNK